MPGRGEGLEARAGNAAGERDAVLVGDDPVGVAVDDLNESGIVARANSGGVFLAFASQAALVSAGVETTSGPPVAVQTSTSRSTSSGWRSATICAM